MTDMHLPAFWQYCPLGDIANLVTKGTTPTTSGFSYQSSGIRFVKVENIDRFGINKESITEFISDEAHKALARSQFCEGDVLFSIAGTIGKTALVDSDVLPANTNQAIAIIRGLSGVFLPEFLKYQLQRSAAEIQKANARGGAMNNISLGDLKASMMLVPPLAEQKVIADKLDTLLAQVDNTKARLERIPEILKTFRQSVLAAAVSGKLTEKWRDGLLNPQRVESIKQDMKSNRFNAWLIEQEKACSKTGRFFDKEKFSAKYDEPSDEYQDEYNLTVISNIPESWLVTNLDNVSIAVTGKTPSTTDECNWGGEIPFITPTQILPAGAVDMPDRFVTEQGAQKIQLLPKGSVLIVCIGTIGKVGLLDADAAFNQQINALIPTNSILSKFLFYWAKTLHSWLNKTSSAVVNAAIINKSRLCAAPCPLPSIEEQTEIVRRVEELFAYADRIEQAAQAAQSRVNNLTQSILAKAFRGELTADWRAANPDLISGDNSAEALLAKIKTERAKLSQTKKGRSKSVEN